MELPTEFWTSHCRRLDEERAAGWLTAICHDVGLAIARLTLAGDSRPTVARIAVEARCSPRSVRRARTVLKARSLLEVAAKFELVDGRPQQRASENRLLVPTEPVTLKPRAPRGGQIGRPSKKEAYRKEECSPWVAKAALAEVARMRMVALGLAR